VSSSVTTDAVHPLTSARAYGPRIPLLTRRSRWGTVAELTRPDGGLRQVRVLPPGTTAGRRRLLVLFDAAPAVGALAGLLVVAVVGWTTPVGLAVAVAGGGLLTWCAVAHVSAPLRAGIRTLTVTTWAERPDPASERDAATMRRCIALADRLDAPGLSALQHELLWGELYFLLPPRD
jgi:hypothetical protein